MFASSYTYIESENKIVVDKNKISDDVAKLSYKGNVTSLYIEPIAVEYGLITRVAKYCAGWDVDYDVQAADVTGDGRVNGLDLLRLAKYFAGWSVQLGQ